MFKRVAIQAILICTLVAPLAFAQTAPDEPSDKVEELDERQKRRAKQRALEQERLETLRQAETALVSAVSDDEALSVVAKFFEFENDNFDKKFPSASSSTILLERSLAIARRLTDVPQASLTEEALTRLDHFLETINIYLHDRYDALDEGRREDLLDKLFFVREAAAEKKLAEASQDRETRLTLLDELLSIYEDSWVGRRAFLFPKRRVKPDAILARHAKRLAFHLQTKIELLRAGPDTDAERLATSLLEYANTLATIDGSPFEPIRAAFEQYFEHIARHGLREGVSKAFTEFERIADERADRRTALVIRLRRLAWIAELSTKIGKDKVAQLSEGTSASDLETAARDARGAIETARELPDATLEREARVLATRLAAAAAGTASNDRVSAAAHYRDRLQELNELRVAAAAALNRHSAGSEPRRQALREWFASADRVSLDDGIAHREHVRTAATLLMADLEADTSPPVDELVKLRKAIAAVESPESALDHFDAAMALVVRTEGEKSARLMELLKEAAELAGKANREYLQHEYQKRRSAIFAAVMAGPKRERGLLFGLDPRQVPSRAKIEALRPGRSDPPGTVPTGANTDPADQAAKLARLKAEVATLEGQLGSAQKLEAAGLLVQLASIHEGLNDRAAFVRDVQKAHALIVSSGITDVRLYGTLLAMSATIDLEQRRWTAARAKGEAVIKQSSQMSAEREGQDGLLGGLFSERPKYSSLYTGHLILAAAAEGSLDKQGTERHLRLAQSNARRKGGLRILPDASAVWLAVHYGRTKNVAALNALQQGPEAVSSASKWALGPGYELAEEWQRAADAALVRTDNGGEDELANVLLSARSAYGRVEHYVLNRAMSDLKTSSVGTFLRAQVRADSGKLVQSQAYGPLDAVFAAAFKSGTVDRSLRASVLRTQAQTPVALALVREWQDLQRQLDEPSRTHTMDRDDRPAMEKRLAEIERDLARRDPKLATLPATGDTSLAALRMHLDTDEALVLFTPTDAFGSSPPELFVWSVTRDQVKIVRAGLSPAEVDDHVAALRCGLDRSAASSEAKACAARGVGDGQKPLPNAALPFPYTRAHALYRGLFGSLERELAGKRLLIVTDGALARLPLQVLLTKAPVGTDPAKMAWLGKRTPITVLPGVASLIDMRRASVSAKSPRSRAVVGFGNPLLRGGPRDDIRAELAREYKACPVRVSDAVRGMLRLRGVTRSNATAIPDLRSWSPLPETAVELCEIADAQGDKPSDVYLAETATETVLKQLSDSGALQAYETVVFSTHGLLAGQYKGSPEPGLVLTPPAQASSVDDGFLSFSEIAALRLDARAVVLSACNTAGSDGSPNSGAQALTGIARAFLYAGARTVIASHWEVETSVTVKLMSGLAKIQRERPALRLDEAMQDAMASLVDGSVAEHRHPSFWAAFSVIGADERIGPAARGVVEFAKQADTIFAVDDDTSVLELADRAVRAGRMFRELSDSSRHMLASSQIDFYERVAVRLLGRLTSKTFDTSVPAGSCDLLAAHPMDPQRAADPVKFDDLSQDEVIEACTAAIKENPKEPRYLFQRSRAHSKLAREPGATASQAAAALDVNAAAAMGYAAAFQNIGVDFDDGQGVKRDRDRGRKMLNEWFNRAIRCCGERLIDALRFEGARTTGGSSSEPALLIEDIRNHMTRLRDPNSATELSRPPAWLRLSPR